ncbi:MAG: YhbY family RNA-binding protein [Verrucomicrobiales bacterium]|nr:YhbY family RNA-binding protein [Verrucomicrobiales bacterium]
MSDSRLPGTHLRRLKALGQVLKPVVHIGKSGLTESLVGSVKQALEDHELIKVKFDALKEQKKTLVVELVDRTASHLIQRVGNVAVLYRQHPEETKRKVALPANPGSAAGTPTSQV